MHDTPRPAPDGPRLARVQAEIERLFAEARGAPLTPEQAQRYGVLLRADYLARQGRAREGEDDEAQAA